MKRFLVLRAWFLKISMTGLKRYEDEKRADEVHSKRRARKSKQCEATAGVRGLAKDAECQPSEKNLRLLNIFDSLQKSSGNLQGLKRRTRGASGALDGVEVGSRKSE
jgi:hypothetical protein